MSLGRLRWPLIISALAVIAVALALVIPVIPVAWDYLSQRWELPKEDVQTGLLTMPADGDKDPLLVRGWISPNKVYVRDPVPFWISFTNKANRAPITNLRFIKFELTEFDTSADGECWIEGPPLPGGRLPRGRLPGCLEGKLNIRGGVLPERLEPGETVSASAKLKAKERPGLYAPTAVFSWTSESGAERRQAISLGPVEVTDPDREKILYRARRLMDIATLLVLPIALVMAGTWLQRAAQAQSERSQRAAQAQSERSQVWQALLGQSVNDNRKYYMPMLSPIKRLERYIEDALRGDEHGRRVSFFALMLFLRRMRFLGDEIGGIHFKDRSGEEVVGRAWSVLNALIEKRFDFENLQLVFRHIDPHEDFFSFEEKYIKTSKSPVERLFEKFDQVFGLASADETQRARVVLRELRGRFDVWLENRRQPFADIRPLLQIIYATTKFEMNRALESWYGGKEEPFPKADLQEAAGRLDKLPQTEAIAGLKKKISEYLTTE